MDWTELFIKDDRLRPIWRLFLCLVLLLFTSWLGEAVLGAAYPLTNAHPDKYTEMLWSAAWLSVAIWVTFKVMVTVFDGKPLGSVGLAFHSRWWSELAQGLAVGEAMLLLAVALEWCCGFARFSFFPHPIWGPALRSFTLFGLAAVNEEALFRGYPFQRLMESITPFGAIAVTSVLFGFVHLGNPQKTWISTVNTVLVGIAFAIAYLRTRSLWMPVGMHFIWNFSLDFVLGLPVSGLNLTASVLTARVQGPPSLTGGGYGPEGSLLATGAILLGTVYLAFTKSIYTSEEMKALAFAPVPASSPDPPMTIFSVPPEEETKRD